MRMNKIFKFLFVFLMIRLSAQLDVSKITPLSPNSASFEKYGIIPVNLSSGTLSPSIPIYTIPVGSYKFHLNFNYSSQGLRVDEHPTNLGMGWSLNLGSITRAVKDVPDNLSGLDIQKVNLPIVGDDHFNLGNLIANSPGVDSERDIFSLNVDGISSKFLLIDNEIQKITLDDIKIEFGGEYFIATSTNGTKYFFGEENAIEETKARPYPGTFIPPTFYPTSYLLSHVDYPNGQKLKFTYSKNRVSYQDNISQNAQIVYTPPQVVPTQVYLL